VRRKRNFKRLRFANCELLQKVGKIQDELKNCRNIARKENDNKEEKVEKTASETGTQELQYLLKRVEVLEKKVATIEELSVETGQIRKEKEEGTENRKEKKEEDEISTKGRMNKEEKGKKEGQTGEIEGGRKLQVVFELRNPMQTPVADKKKKLMCIGRVSAENTRRINNVLAGNKQQVVVANLSLARQKIALHINGGRVFEGGAPAYEVQLIQKPLADGDPVVRPGFLKKLGGALLSQAKLKKSLFL
jgi:hypothetical protein